ncbi:MAG: hypothetical protein JOY99_04975 [Sphingomonadaceae bacterium]|nr:hypothetical protein [Sphingomonadaceae bacterium]
MKTIARLVLLSSCAVALPAAALAQSPAPAANSASKTPQASTAQGGPTAGATVYDTSGNIVGTIDSVDNQFAVLATSKSKVKLPLTSFAAGPKGPLLGMTAAQVDAAAGAASGADASASATTAAPATASNNNAAPAASTPATGAGPQRATTTATNSTSVGAPPKLQKGASVSDSKGGKVGTIDSVDSQFATVATAKNKVRLPLTAFANGPNGPVIGMTADQLDQAASAAKSGS